MRRNICTICCALFVSLFSCGSVSAQSIDPLLITVATGPPASQYLSPV
jgi:hypothetical protein